AATYPIDARRGALHRGLGGRGDPAQAGLSAARRKPAVRLELYRRAVVARSPTDPRSRNLRRHSRSPRPEPDPLLAGADRSRDVLWQPEYLCHAVRRLRRAFGIRDHFWLSAPLPRLICDDTC